MICIACKEELKEGANICPHCGQFQNWKRHITATNLFLGLLITLFSVSGLIFSLVKDTFIIERAKLTLAITSSTFDDFDFLISNLGSKSAVATNFSVQHKNDSLHSSHILSPDILGKVIEPNKTYTVKAKTKNNQNIPITAPPLLAAYNPEMWDKCYLQVQLTHYDGAIEIQQLPFACSIPKGAN